jgi:hypothetical protein
MTDAACISSTGVLTVGAPARWATSASPVASITHRARIASRPAFGLDDHARHRVSVHDRRDDGAVQHGLDPRLLDQAVGDELEALALDLVRARLRLAHRGAHLARAVLELAADPARLDCPLVAVPGEPPRRRPP